MFHLVVEHDQKFSWLINWLINQPIETGSTKNQYIKARSKTMQQVQEGRFLQFKTINHVSPWQIRADHIDMAENNTTVKKFHGFHVH